MSFPLLLLFEKLIESFLVINILVFSSPHHRVHHQIPIDIIVRTIINSSSSTLSTSEYPTIIGNSSFYHPHGYRTYPNQTILTSHYQRRT